MGIPHRTRLRSASIGAGAGALEGRGLHCNRPAKSYRRSLLPTSQCHVRTVYLRPSYAALRARAIEPQPTAEKFPYTNSILTSEP